MNMQYDSKIVKRFFDTHIGGYVGLFVGYTVAQFPELLNWAMKKGKGAANFIFGNSI